MWLLGWNLSLLTAEPTPQPIVELLEDPWMALLFAFLLLLETKSYHVAQADLKLGIFLAQITGIRGHQARCSPYQPF